MPIFADFRFDVPFMRRVISAVPGMEIETEQLNRRSDGRLQYICWAIGSDFTAFESSLSEDPTVVGFRLLADLDEKRLYRLILPEKAGEMYTEVVENDIQIIDSRLTNDGTVIQARVPSADELDEFQDLLDAVSDTVTVTKLQTADGEPPTGLTRKQRETLRLARERGYFEVPREATNEDLAEELDLTDAAIAHRLRRGMKTLIDETLGEPMTRGGTQQILLR